VNHDAIAVVDWVDTNNVKYLFRFKGVVSRYGGVLSHGAIVCREYGIPSVFNVLDSIDEIQEGTLISIDGRTGHIKMGKQ
ncbi:MAG: PEP-utilizing enzyme, partial [Bacteroidota bacterium]|nr:PEP-utilizing enzyme [Bacteroidota bacterium]